MNGSTVVGSRGPRWLVLLTLTAAIAPIGCGGTSTGTSTEDASVADGEGDSSSPADSTPEAPADADDASETSTEGGDTSPEAGCGAKTSCGGSCVDTTSDTKNCGGCGHDCTTLPGVDATKVTCSSGKCVVVGACQEGRAHCSSSPEDGCETDISTAAHCGACTTTCAEPTPLCSKDMSGTYACSSGCSGMTPTRCTGACVDTTSDPKNCGGCGKTCPAPSGATATCTASTCGYVCNPGFHTCDSSCVSNSDPMTCGASCLPCPSVWNATATCDGKSCGYACNADAHDCGGWCGNRFELRSCGGRCAPCPVPANGMATCDGTDCKIACASGYHPCGSVCALDSDPATCGSSCGCPDARPHAHRTCVGGACGDACDAGYHDCGGACVPDLDPATCGSSCTACTAPANSSPTCNGVSCGFTCSAGYHACGAGCALNTSLATCGSSCSPCPTPPHATPSCDGTSCKYACLPGYADCDGNAANGCELTLSDPSATALFCDGFEAGLANWTSDGRWNTWAKAATGNYSYNGYWGGDLATGCNITNRGWMIRPVDLRGFTTATLKFTDQAVAGTSDSLYVYVSTNSGSTWSLVGSSGASSSWTPRTIDLTPYVGSATLQVRFLFQNVCGDCCGVDWYIDDVMIMAK